MKCRHNNFRIESLKSGNKEPSKCIEGVREGYTYG